MSIAAADAVVGFSETFGCGATLTAAVVTAMHTAPCCVFFGCAGDTWCAAAGLWVCAYAVHVHEHEHMPDVCRKKLLPMHMHMNTRERGSARWYVCLCARAANCTCLGLFVVCTITIALSLIGGGGLCEL